MSLVYSISDADFLSLVRQCSSIQEVLFTLGYTNSGGNNNLLFNQRCQELGIDWRQEMCGNNSQIRQKRTFNNIFCQNSTVDQSTLRAWYLKGKYTQYQCSICKISSWQGQELHLRLDHINGCNNDNRLENLRWLCPNCDSQQDTYCGRNLKHRALQEDKYCKKCGNLIISADKKTISSEEYRTIKTLINKKTILCAECSKKSRRKVIDRPSRTELEKLLKQFNFSEVGKMYNVSDNAVRKWCKKYNLSIKSSDYRPQKPIKKSYNPQTNRPCGAFDKNHREIKKFNNVREAAIWLQQIRNYKNLDGVKSHIKEAANKKIKQFGGFIWQFLDDKTYGGVA